MTSTLEAAGQEKGSYSNFHKGSNCHTLVCLFLVSHASPSLIHMAANVLFSISHSCQILKNQERGGICSHFLFLTLCAASLHSKTWKAFTLFSVKSKTLHASSRLLIQNRATSTHLSLCLLENSSQSLPKNSTVSVPPEGLLMLGDILKGAEFILVPKENPQTVTAVPGTGLPFHPGPPRLLTWTPCS